MSPFLAPNREFDVQQLNKNRSMLKSSAFHAEARLLQRFLDRALGGQWKGAPQNHRASTVWRIPEGLNLTIAHWTPSLRLSSGLLGAQWQLLGCSCPFPALPVSNVLGIAGTLEERRAGLWPDVDQSNAGSTRKRWPNNTLEAVLKVSRRAWANSSPGWSSAVGAETLIAVLIARSDTDSRSPLGLADGFRGHTICG